MNVLNWISWLQTPLARSFLGFPGSKEASPFHQMTSKKWSLLYIQYIYVYIYIYIAELTLQFVPCMPPWDLRFRRNSRKPTSISSSVPTNLLTMEHVSRHHHSETQHQPELNEPTWATKKNLTTFHYTAWWIGVLVMAYYSSLKIG